MTRFSCFLMLLTFSAALTGATSADAATVTQQVYVNFDGSLAGTTYTLGAGEIDNSGTFASNGSATVSGGMADIPGDTDLTSGFYFHGPSLGLGSLQTQNWITEAIIVLDVPVASQPDGPGGEGDDYNHFLDVQGDTFYRFNGDGRTPKITQIGYWDGGSEPTLTVTNPPANQRVHAALTWNAGTNTLEAFLAGVSQGSVSTGSPFDVSSANVGYGFFSRFLNRAIDGKLDAVAFSTYTGTFNAASDFQLPVVPEPNSLALLTIALALLVPRSAKK